MPKIPTSSPLRQQLRAEMAAALVAYNAGFAASGVPPREVSLAYAKAQARLEANQHDAAVAFGLQRNQVTGELEAGWVPAAYAYRPGWMVEVHGIAHPDGVVSEVAESARVPAWCQPDPEPEHVPTENRLRLMEQGL